MSDRKIRRKLLADPQAYDLEVLREQLDRLIDGDRQRLQREDVYQLSVQLDRLIVRYMKACV